MTLMNLEIFKIKDQEIYEIHQSNRAISFLNFHTKVSNLILTYELNLTRAMDEVKVRSTS